MSDVTGAFTPVTSLTLTKTTVATDISSDFTTEINSAVNTALALLNGWAAETAYTQGAVVKPSVANGFYYECSTAGTTVTTEPTWPTTVDETVEDGTAVWTCKEISHNVPDFSTATLSLVRLRDGGVRFNDTTGNTQVLRDPVVTKLFMALNALA
jgi:hypothetical protein